MANGHLMLKHREKSPAKKEDKKKTFETCSKEMVNCKNKLIVAGE